MINVGILLQFWLSRVEAVVMHDFIATFVLHACGGQYVSCLTVALSVPLHSKNRFIVLLTYWRGLWCQDVKDWYGYLMINVELVLTDSDSLLLSCTSRIFQDGIFWVACLMLSLGIWVDALISALLPVSVSDSGHYKSGNDSVVYRN